MQYLEHVLVREDAGHDAVHVAGEDARGVGHRFAATKLRRPGIQHQRRTAELAHRHVERHAGSRR